MRPHKTGTAQILCHQIARKMFFFADLLRSFHPFWGFSFYFWKHPDTIPLRQYPSSATGWIIFFELWSGQQALEHDQTVTFAGWRADHIGKRPTGRCRVFFETIVTKHVELVSSKWRNPHGDVSCMDVRLMDRVGVYPLFRIPPF